MQTVRIVRQGDLDPTGDPEGEVGQVVSYDPADPGSVERARESVASVLGGRPALALFGGSSFAATTFRSRLVAWTRLVGRGLVLWPSA